MTEPNDFYWLTMDREDDALRSAAGLRPILARLDESFLPKPKTLEVPGARDGAIDGWLEPKIGKAVDKGKASIGLKAPGIQAAARSPDQRRG